MNLGSFTLIPSADYSSLHWVAFDILGQRRVTARHLFEVEEGWEKMPRLFLEVETRRRARLAASYTNLEIALTFTNIGEGRQDPVLLAKAGDALFQALEQDDAEKSAKWFSRLMGTPASPELTLEFEERFLPSVSLSADMRLMAAEVKQGELIRRFPTQREEILAMAGPTPLEGTHASKAHF